MIAISLSVTVNDERGACAARQSLRLLDVHGFYLRASVARTMRARTYTHTLGKKESKAPQVTVKLLLHLFCWKIKK